MTSAVERGNVKKLSMDRWSTRERLCLASAVFRSGDQNWMSVSRSLRMFGEPNRPPDWFSQKNCAVQYSMLLENVETPKRKKRSEKGEVHVETPGESIVRKLTNERIEELKLMMQEKRAAYLRLKEEVMQVRAGHADDRLPDMLREIEDEKKQKEKIAEAHEQWLREREEKKLDMERNWKPVSVPAPSQSPVHRRKGGLPRPVGGRRSSSQSEHSSEADSPISEPLNVEIVGEEPPVDVKPPIAPMPTSPLLTSLLKSPSPAPNAQTSLLQQAITNRGSSPTITSLLSSSPAVPTTVSSSLKNLVSNALSGVAASVDHSLPSSTSPSAGAPTLSMLLEMPPNAPGQPLPELPTTASKPLPPPVGKDDKLRHLQRDPSALPPAAKNNESLKIVLVEPKSEPVEHIPIQPKEEPVEEELIEEMIVSDEPVLDTEVIPEVPETIANGVPETIVTEELQAIIKKERKEEYTLDPQTTEPVIQVKMEPVEELSLEDDVSELVSTSLPSCVTKDEKIEEDAESTNKNEQIASSSEEIVLDKDFEMIIEGTMQELAEESETKDVSGIAEVVEFEEGTEVKEVIPPDLADMEVIILGKVNDEVVNVSDETKLLEVVVEKEESNVEKVQTDTSGEVTSIPLSNEAETAREKLCTSGTTMELQDANVSQSMQDDEDYTVDVCTSSVDVTEAEETIAKQDRKAESKHRTEEEKSQQIDVSTRSKALRSSSPDSRTEEEGPLQNRESLVSKLSIRESEVPIGNEIETELSEVVRSAGATTDHKIIPGSDESPGKGSHDGKLASASADEPSKASEIVQGDKVVADKVSELRYDSKKTTNMHLRDDDQKMASAHTVISGSVYEQLKESRDTLIKPGKKSGTHREDTVHVTIKDTNISPSPQDASNDRKEVELSLIQEEHQKKKGDNHKTVEKHAKEESTFVGKTSHAIHREKTMCDDAKNNSVPERKDVNPNVRDRKDNKKEVTQQEVKENVRGGREGDKEGKRENVKKQLDDNRKKTETDKKDVKEVNRITTKKGEKENTRRRDGSAKRKEDNAEEREDVKKRAVERDDRKDVVSKEGLKRELDTEGSAKKLDTRKSEKNSKMENRKERKKSDSRKENEAQMLKKAVELPPEPVDVKTVSLQQDDTTESECESEKTCFKDMYVQSSTRKDARKIYGDTHTEAQQENAKGGKLGTHAIRADTPSTEEEKTSDAESSKPFIKKRSAAATADSVPSSPGYHTEDEREYKAWKKAIMLVYGRLATHKYASLFLRPITDDQAPGYSGIVHRPMDLLMIKKNIETGMIRTTTEFQRDVLLMFQNSIMYNKSSHFVHKMARQMQQEGMQHIQDFLTTQMLVQVVGEVPLRRETRTTEANKNRDVLSGQEETDVGGKRKRLSGAETERHKKRKV
ncbi:bromodomain-containing protein 8 isoform X1 [Schistocerca americana]|uniref:bromodomain-containing protein 8 isoform X1 n=1 Tax=Schistocerca americana TaxID=7009 RepID=UPI001F4F9C03|nr:bromodomain-containing protein 8 isoform X1 [Schistocerca americana]